MKENEPSEVDEIPSKMINETIEALEHIISLVYMCLLREGIVPLDGRKIQMLFLYFKRF